MQHEMRRFKQLLPEAETKEILQESTHGVLSLVDAEGVPYGVPLSFVYDGGNVIYFHCATTGHKIDCISANQSCSFCVVAQDVIIPEKFTTYFRSVICFGRVTIVSDGDELKKGLIMLAGKYSPGIDSAMEISRFINNVTLLRLEITAMTGKESIELTHARHLSHVGVD